MPDHESLLRALPPCIVAVFFCYCLLMLYAPQPLQSERLWLEWLGTQILTHGEIPRALGREVVQGAGSPWLPHEWLFATLLAWCARHHCDAVMMLGVAGCATVPLLCTFARLRNCNAGAAAISFALIFLSLTLAVQVQMRASLVAYAAFAIVCAALGCRDRRQYTIVAAVLLLANMHATVTLIALLPAAACVVDLAARRSVDRDARRYALTAIAALLASCCSPFGADVYRYAFALGSGEVHTYITEWSPLLGDLGSPLAISDLVIATLLIALIVVWHMRKPLGAVEMMLLGLSGLLMLYAERFAPLFIIAALPVALRYGLRTPGQAFALLRKPFLIGCVAAVALLPATFRALVHAAQTQTLVENGRPALIMPAEWLDPYRIAAPARERVFCSDYAYCNAYLRAGASVLLDGRTDPFPISAFETTVFIDAVKPGWLQTLHRLDLNVVVVGRETTKLEAAMARAPGWLRVAESADTITYLRRGTGGNSERARGNSAPVR